MERPQICIEPTVIGPVGDSAQRLGASLAEQQIEVVQGAYRQRYERGISSFWESQLIGSELTGAELARLQLEVKRIVVMRLAKFVGLLGVPWAVVGFLFFGVAVSVGLFGLALLIGLLSLLRN